MKKKNDGLAGGLGILAATVYLCYKGLKRVDERLRKKKEKKP